MSEKISVPVNGEQLRLLRAAVPPEAGDVQFPEPDTPEGVVRVDGELVAVRHIDDGDGGQQECRIYRLKGLFAIAIQGQRLSIAEYDEVRAMGGGSKLIDPTENDIPFVIVPESLLRDAASAIEQPPDPSAQS